MSSNTYLANRIRETLLEAADRGENFGNNDFERARIFRALAEKVPGSMTPDEGWAFIKGEIFPICTDTAGKVAGDCVVGRPEEQANPRAQVWIARFRSMGT